MSGDTVMGGGCVARPMRGPAFVVVVALLFLSGCTREEAAEPGAPTPATGTGGASPSPATTAPSPVTSTPSPSPGVPTATTPPEAPAPTPVSPTPPPPEPVARVARAVVASMPDRLTSPGVAQVCARIEGEGRVPLVALHTAREPRGDAAAFSAYDGALFYPGGAATPSQEGYALPGVFCFPVRVEIPTWVRVHARAPGGGPVLAPEQRVDVGPAPDVRFAHDVPEVWAPSKRVTLCWAAPAGPLARTSLVWDVASRAEASGYTGGEVFPNNGTAVAATGPGPFCAAVPVPEDGSLFVRPRAIVDGEDVLGPEERIVATRAVSIVSAPSHASAGQDVVVCWRAEGSGASPHTALHWDTVPHPNATSFQEYSGAPLYPDNATSARRVELPGPWCTGLRMPPSGAIHLRAHVLVPGTDGSLARDELSEEFTIVVR